MEDSSLDRLELLFRAARMHPPDERSAFLDAACAGDEELRRELDSLLAADTEAESGGFLDMPAIERLEEIVTRTDADVPEGTAIGPYRVVRLLGRGGMGDVYLAMQEEPFRRYVALKIIRRGMDTIEVLKRFEMERQILASLDDPHIARLLDGGMTSDGLPYFAMEYVDGEPITKFCESRRLSIDGRLRLFQTVCRAVQHAHRNLVLHRDLKPSNILVTGDGVVKLVDFGIAKLLNPSLVHLDFPITRTELRMMTPEYASPEQVRGEALSTASDVYSLGVVLYELLCGCPPYRLSTRTTDEIFRTVCEDDPPPPSARTGDTAAPEKVRDGVVAARGAKRRQGNPGERLKRRLRGDLDNIVMMALRKEPDRRYPSAEQLSQDIERHLDGRPVRAHRDSRGYRIGKFVRRHRAETAAAGVILILLAFFVLFTIDQSAIVATERDRARLEAERAEQVTKFLLSLFETADPHESPIDTLTVRQVLETGAERIETELAGQPAVQATMLSAIASAFRNLGRHDRARPLLEKALALRRQLFKEDHPDLAISLYDLAATYEYGNDYERADPLFREYVAMQRRLHGGDHPSMLSALYHLGLMLHVQGKSTEADSILTEWHRMQDQLPQADDPEVVENLGGVSEILFAQRRFDEAERMARKALAMGERLFGRRDSRIGLMLNRLGWILIGAERFAEAESVARDALALNSELYPDGHWNLADSYANLGEALMGQDELDEAERWCRQDLALRRKLFGDEHYTVGRSYGLLARLMRKEGRLAEAEDLYRRAASNFERLLGRSYLTTIQYRLDLASVLTERRDYDGAEELLLDCLATLRHDRGADDRETQDALRRLVTLYESRGNRQEAARYRGMLVATAER